MMIIQISCTVFGMCSTTNTRWMDGQEIGGLKNVTSFERLAKACTRVYDIDV